MSAFAISERARTAIELGESHFREFKSALEGPPGSKQKRPIKDIATNIAQTLVAFANADGGELLIGVEDSGEITGLLGFSDSEIDQLEQAPVTRVHTDTPLPTVRKYRLDLDNKKILYFSVSKSTQFIHITSDGRCLQRRDLESIPVATEAVQFDRQERKSREYDREFVDGVSADDLDINLVRIVADQVSKGMSPEKCLQYLDLGEYGMSQLRLRRASLLLFGKIPSKWHPRLQIRILKVDGESVLTGEDYNVISDELVAGNILTLVDRAWEALRPHLIHTRFDKSGRFERRSMYPELACREALLNAIAHRDYSDEGRGIEVYAFDNHLEVRNPGALLSSIRLEDIASQKGVHQSRNTHIARVLRELGYMRELGEGMRRIYDLMHRNELAPPKLESSPDGFKITLTHLPLYTAKDLLWLGQFDHFALDREQKAVVLLGENGSIFSAQQVWDAVGIVDTEHYRKLVDTLMKLDILDSRVNKQTAQNLAKRKRIPFREFPRYGIKVPKTTFSNSKTGTAISKQFIVGDQEDIRDDSKRLYVGNLPRKISKDELFDLFAQFGEVAEMYLPFNLGSSKGYAFVEFASVDETNAALSAKDLRLGNNLLVLKIASGRK
ncbi:ATP-binding protein [Undibacterium sp. TS12]|uniref:ATP-binding protein n=1 Tax=Undibacterium sp. TS12 TaxID=2908202 RepID=UPI001F4C8AC7|nr:ATP-binding protein [Undibacterium sp. TS12]MCH8619633.1 putative DNA binding domain-containing protein [Undibacterium sp. TS12]